jgi:hypothetical protein
MGSVNFHSILAKTLKSRGVQEQARVIIEEKVGEIKNDLLHDFNTHPATKEIEAGPELESSDVLPVGYGNLYSFLGFEDGSNPTMPVREKLESISVIKAPVVHERSISFKVNMPNEEELNEAAPMHWEAGKSWIEAIEKGLSGFSHYLFTLSRNVGRSGAGVQTEANVRGEQFTGTPYLLEMLSKFKARLKKIK